MGRAKGRLRAMQLVLSLLLAIAFVPVSSVEYSLQPPLAVRRGEPGFATLECSLQRQDLEPLTLQITYPDGGVSPRYVGTRPQSKNVAKGDVESAGPSAARLPTNLVVFLFSVPVDTVPGEAAMVAFDAAGMPIAGSRFNVLDRQYSREDLWLDRGLTSLRVDPDPRKTEQARRYLELIGRTDPAANYLDSGFVRPVDTERRTSAFGLLRRYLYADGGVDRSMHNGIDYGCPIGTKVVASGAGRVVMAEERIVTGNTIVLEHLPGAYTIYMHLDSMNVTEGSIVPRGALLGRVGMTGLATGPHLHWEFRVMGVPCDPEALIGIDKMPTIRKIDGVTEGG